MYFELINTKRLSIYINRIGKNAKYDKYLHGNRIKYYKELDGDILLIIYFYRNNYLAFSYRAVTKDV